MTTRIYTARCKTHGRLSDHASYAAAWEAWTRHIDAPDHVHADGRTYSGYPAIVARDDKDA